MLFAEKSGWQRVYFFVESQKIRMGLLGTVGGGFLAMEN